MQESEIKQLFQRIAGMVASVELATAGLLQVLVENGVIDREVALKGLIAKRDALDPKFSQGGFDNLIEALSPLLSGDRH